MDKNTTYNYWRKMCFCFAFISLYGIAYTSLARSNFLNNGDDTVTHATTRLMWQQAPQVESRSYAHAVAYCGSLILAGHNDWRLPSLKELLSIIDYKRFDPAVDPIAFAGLPTDRPLWAHSQFLGNTTLWGMKPLEGRIEKYGAPSDVTRFALPLCVRTA